MGSLRLTMELAPYLAPTLSTSPTAGSSTSTTKLTTSLEMLPPSLMKELPHTQTLSVLPTLSLDMPSPTLPLDMPLPTLLPMPSPLWSHTLSLTPTSSVRLHRTGELNSG